MTFFRSATEAENAGFRACRRCRPDLAPFSAQWFGTAAVIGRALAMISRGEADEASMTQFAEKLGVSDRHLRRNSNFIQVEIPLIAPFNWDHIVDFLTNHRVHGVESLSAGRYRRSFSCADTTGAIDVGYDKSKTQLSAKIFMANPTQLREVIERIRDVFDTRVNPHAHLVDLRAKDSIANLYRRELGLRIPGAWDPYETAVGIILGQLVSVEQARLKMRKLIEQFGRRIPRPVFADCNHLFPEAHVLAGASFRDLGITKTREHAIRELSRLVVERKIDLSRSANLEETKKQLLDIRGVGPWTVEMIAMRCLGDTNAFPKTDLIVQRALKHHRNEKGDWSPWNAYITLALWHKYARSLSNKPRKSVTLKL